MKFINYTNDGRVVVQHAALILSKLDEADTLELHTMDNAIILLKKDMTRAETRDVLQGMVRLARSMTLDALCNSDAEDKTPLVDESFDDEYEDNSSQKFYCSKVHIIVCVPDDRPGEKVDSSRYYNGYDSSLDCMAHINTSIFIVLLLPKVRFRIAAYYEALTFAHSRFRP